MSIKISGLHITSSAEVFPDEKDYANTRLA